MKKKVKKILSEVLYYYYKIFKPKFIFQKKKYNYFCGRYNVTWLNERAVEIPIVLDIINKYKDKKSLEVGNILSHYFRFDNDILDKYEKAKGVINKDVIDFKPKIKYDLIISISTLEHVGWDENPKNPIKILHAIKNLKENCLKPNGKMIVTFPFGYNTYIDRLIKEDKLSFIKIYYLKRLPLNKWKETTYNDIKLTKFNFKSGRANSIIIGMINNKSLRN